MAKYRLYFLALSLVVGSLGCRSVDRPNWLHPGPAAYQQGRAEQYDPYPENEPGPAIVGGRPRGYEKPFAEPTRARWIAPWSWMAP